MYQDKTLKCIECGKDFVFSAGEQEFYEKRELKNEPKRCKECRNSRKNANREPQEPRETFTAVCDKCGGEAILNFKPNGDRPVYCKKCYDEIRGRG